MGEMGAQKFFLQMGHYPTRCTSKISDPQILRGVGEKCLKFFSLFHGSNAP